MTTRISSGRKSVYYAGMALMGIGLLLFAWTLVEFISRFGDFTDFEERARSSGIRAFGGMALIVIGNVLRTTGARGLAGSGVVLDPEQARADLAPFSRQAGGMVKDAIEAADIRIGGAQKVVMVKCRACARLNEEDSKFCQECGKPL